MAGDRGEGCGAGLLLSVVSEAPATPLSSPCFGFPVHPFQMLQEDPPWRPLLSPHLEATLLICHNLPPHPHKTKILVNGLGFTGDSQSEMPPSSSQISSSLSLPPPLNTHTHTTSLSHALSSPNATSQVSSSYVCVHMQRFSCTKPQKRVPEPSR